MKFSKASTALTWGTSLQGEINVAYAELKKKFGMPGLLADCYKMDAHWAVLFNDGTVATIYNWKNGKNYKGARGTPKTRITEWHVGGVDKKSVERVLEALAS